MELATNTLEDTDNLNEEICHGDNSMSKGFELCGEFELEEPSKYSLVYYLWMKLFCLEMHLDENGRLGNVEGLSMVARLRSLWEGKVKYSARLSPSCGIRGFLDRMVEMNELP
ncbi:hypothetical protein ACH5RR_026198 [Cinchona calisaya]|uniref:Uncharacterized protein n=1 Tax=Cinchona calisaya TaxID=153742 RepID=A0ABD2Z254_9GENT